MTKTKRRRTDGVGSTIRTQRFTLRFDGMQGELFAPTSSKAWTLLKPGHKRHGETLHLPVYLNRKEVIAEALKLV